MNNDIILKMRNVSKSFNGVEVLHGVDFDLKRGEVHVLIGENGAGKSTLMKVLTGIYPCDKGEIELLNENGGFEKVVFDNVRDSQKHGIGMVFQECNLMNNLSIAENIYIGREPIKNGVVDFRKMYREAAEELKKVDVDISPKTIVETLPVAGKQCVEIAKCLSLNANIIILDEPTSSLSEKEVRMLFALIETLKKQGVSIIYISHRMNEIFEIGDRITVFRDGSKIDTLNVLETDEDNLVKLMIGREFERTNKNISSYAEKKLMLEVKDVSVANFDAKINFSAYAGEVLGIFGLVGAGRTELARQIFGVDRVTRGSIYKDSEKLKLTSPVDAIKNRIGLVSEDRKEVGLITMHTIWENLAIVKLLEWPWLRLSKKEEQDISKSYMDKLEVISRGVTQCVNDLSGGNQQKIAIAKWLSVDMDILILDEPTRGVDVKTKAIIYNIIREEASKGKCIIVISSDLPEILNVSQRVIVMHDGAITLDAPVSELDQEAIMHAAIS